MSEGFGKKKDRSLNDASNVKVRKEWNELNWKFHLIGLIAQPIRLKMLGAGLKRKCKGDIQSVEWACERKEANGMKKKMAERMENAFFRKR